MESKDTFRDLQFDGRPSGYRDFRRKTILAVAGQENKLTHLAGPRLLQRLQGEAWRATEHLQIAELRKPDGWLEVIHALDKHYRFLPETELHEAVEEFLFGMKRKSGEGATSFSSRFRTQLSRVQSLIAQEREVTKLKRRGKRGKRATKSTPSVVEHDSSLEESAVSEVPRREDRPRSVSATGDESAAAPPAADPARASASAQPEAARETSDPDAEREQSVHSVRSQPPSSHGSKRKSDHGSRVSRTSRGTYKADKERQDRKMLEMLGSLEYGHLRPKPIFPQAILGHLYMRKFGMNREQRAHIIRSTNGSSRLDDVERIIRASDLEEFRNEDRRRDDRKPLKQPRRDTYAVHSEPQHAMLADDGNDSSSLVEDFDDDSDSEEAFVAAGDEDGDTEQELQEIYEIQKKAKKDFRKSFKTYKESRKKVREIKKSRAPYLPVVAINQPQDAQASGQAPVLRQTFGYDKKTGGKAQPKRKSDSKPAGKREEANLATTTVVEQFSYMVSSNDMIDDDVWLTTVPEGYAILDTGCTTSIVGSETAESLTKFMGSHGWPLPVSCTLPPVELKGFNGNKVESTDGLRWNVKLGNLWGTITTYVVPGSAPFLLSRRVLEGMQARLDLGALTITSEKHGMIDAPLRQASNGHLLLPLIHVPPELITSTADDAADSSVSQENEPNDACPEHFAVACEDPPAPVSHKPCKITTSDRRRALQHVVKNTRRGVVNITRFQKELEIIFGGKGKDIVHALVAYKPRLERIPADANTVAYQRSVATLSTDGQFLVQPWHTRPAGEVRCPVNQVNVCMFAYIAPESVEPASPVMAEHEHNHHHHHTCFCCRECDSEGDDVCFQEGGDDGWSMEAVYGESTNWTEVPKMQAMSPESQKKLKAGIQKLRKTYAQFIMSRLTGNHDEMIEELTEWLGPQAPKLHETVSMIEVFTGKAPLAERVEQFGSTCIRIGLDYGHDLNQHSQRRKLLLLIALCQPKDVWISFPCGCWGPWSRMNMHRDPSLAQSTLEARQIARRHLSIVPEIWNLQQSLGGFTHIENPLTSDAWKEFQLHMAYDVRIDQCSLGLRCPRTKKPILKPTRIVTSCKEMATRLAKCRCDHRHEHAHLEGSYKGKPLTSYAETYPRKMCRVIAEVLTAPNRVQSKPEDVFASLDDPDIEQDAMSDAAGAEPGAELANPAEPPVPKQRIQSMLRKLHVNTGHSSIQQMLRLANRCQVSDEIKQEIKKFKCDICDEHKVPPSHRQSAIPHAEQPNHIVGIDFVQVELKHVNDQGDTVEDKYNVLTCVDLATDFAQQIIVPPGGHQLAKAFHSVWTRPYGAPKIIYTDPDSATMSKDFEHYMLNHDIKLLHCGAESHWQLGRVEIANRVLRGMAQRVWQDTDRPAAEVIEVCASIRNQQLRKHGFSPCQWFLGHDTKHAGMLHDVEEQRNFPMQSQILVEPEFQARVLLRENAARAFLEEHAKDTWRRALASRSRPMRGPYTVGQLVYFFRKRARGLLSTRHGVWYGPGKVIGCESSTNGVIPRVVWVAFNGFLYKCSPEGLRPMTEDETQFRELARSLSQGRLDPAIENAEQSLSSRAPQYHDLMNEKPEESDEELEDDVRHEPRPLEDPDEEGGPRKIRRRITKSNEYWQKRSRGMPPYGSLQEGSLPQLVGPHSLASHQDEEPPAKRRAVLDDIPEEIEEDGLSYEPGTPIASEAMDPPDAEMDQPTEPLEPAAEAIDDASQEGFAPGPSDQLDVPTNDDQSNVEQTLQQAIEQHVPSDDDGLMVETNVGRAKLKESVLEVSIDVNLDDITSDPFCLFHVLDECLTVAAPKAKLRRVEVSYRKLQDHDKALFQKAMQKEWQSWVDNRVTSLCKNRGISPDRIIRARWVLTWKKSSDPDDKSRVPKARLVLIGWEDPELGKIATDSPTLRKESKHLALSICAAMRWKVFGADIKTAFLSGDNSQREIYFKPPAELKEWLQLSNDDLFRLEKAAYGLAEAPRAWFLRLSREMREAGLCQSQIDPCLFTLRVKGKLCGICGIHVDDLLGGGTPAMDAILNKLRAKLPFGDYRTFTIRYTGIEVRQNPNTFEIEIGQEAYVDAMECVQTKPLGNASTPLPDKSILRTCAGQLAWVSNATRPDQAFLSSYLQGVQDKGLVSHVQLYNKGVREMKEKKVCLRFPSTVPISDWRLVCIADAGWATRDSGDSQGGYLLLIAESKMLDRERARCWLVDWSSKKLKRAVRSSVAAETLSGQNGLDALELFQALMLETLDGITPRQFREMTPSKPGALVIDSKGFYDAITRSCCSQAISVERRLQIDYAIAKETMKKQNILPFWVNNLRMAADCLTKLRGETKLLYDILELGYYQIKVCAVSGRREKAGEGSTKNSQP